MKIAYAAREGRRTKQGYKILWIVRTEDGRHYEIAAPTLERAVAKIEAIESALAGGAQ